MTTQTASRLPQAFAERVRGDLGAAEAELLLAALGREPASGLRVNSRFGSVASVLAALGWPAQRLPWVPEGVSLAGPAPLHPWHDAGVYYLQDPSAMGIVPVLDPRPGDWVLDLAAAPGGKSTHIADRLGGAGLLWSHDVDTGRATALVGNLERWGAANVVVSHGPIARLAPLRGRFDRVLLDAPCSGEGMFRKSRPARNAWSVGRVRELAAQQVRALAEAAEFLAPGGVLVYSTCTFGADENEAVVGRVLARRPALVPDPVSVPGTSPGLEPHTTDAGLGGAVVRWWPQRQVGEGHVAIRLRDVGGVDSPVSRAAHREPPGVEPSAGERAAVLAFTGDDVWTARGAPLLRRFGEWLHAVPDLVLPAGMAPRRVGIPLGRLSHGRFEPHHAATRLFGDTAAGGMTRVATTGSWQLLDLEPHDRRVSDYLGGLVIEAEVADGWTLVAAGGAPLGWARAKQGELNNRYPKGLRRA